MSTFFEKLTGAPSKTVSQTQDVPVATKKEVIAPRPAPSDTKKPKTTHLAIEAEGEAATIQPEPETGEEGELTVDIYDKDDSIIIQSTVAGVKPEDLDVSITNDTVIIHGKREHQEEIEEKNYYYKELFWGGFSRSVILPEEVEEDEAEASLKHGLLTIRLPKKKKGVVQKLKVKVT